MIILWCLLGVVTVLVAVANAVRVVQCLPPLDQIAELIRE